MSTEKKPLITKGIIPNGDDKVFTLKFKEYEKYKNRNMGLILEADGKPYCELTVDIRDALKLHWVVINKENEAWIKELILKNKLGSFIGKYYIDDVAYSVYSLDKFKMDKFCDNGYTEYIQSLAEGKRGLTKEQLIDREHRYHWKAIQKSKRKPVSQKRKGAYKTSTNTRISQKKYYDKTEKINAYLPKGMKSDIEQYGEKASVILKKRLLQYLDECELKGEE